MSDLPEFSQSQKPSDWSAAQLRNLSIAARKINNLRAGPGLEIRHTDSGIEINLTEAFRKSQPREATVVLTHLPEKEDTLLCVRKVRHITIPPQPSRENCDDGIEGKPVCTYGWDGPDFEAYPDFGSVAMSYSAFYWPPEDPPMLKTDFLRAKFRDGYWFVEAQIGAERMVVIRAYVDDEPDPQASRFIIVQEVTLAYGEEGNWTGGYEATGDAVKVNVWPTMFAGQFAPFIWAGDEITDLTTILPLASIGGIWWLKQRPKRAIVRRTGPLKLLDCTAVEPQGAS